MGAKKSVFTFIPMLRLNELAEEHQAKTITFYGSTGNYVQINRVKYITLDGHHVATRVGLRTTWNPETYQGLTIGFVAAVRRL